MTNGKIFQTGPYPADQYCFAVVKKIPLQCQGRGALSSALPGLRQASIAIYPGSKKGKRDIANTRTKSGIDCQTPHQLGPKLKRAGIHWGIAQCPGDTCFTNLSSERKAWLKGVGTNGSRSATSLTGWVLGNSLKFIACLYPKERSQTPVGAYPK